MKTKTLIVLYSYHHGNTEKIAHVFSRVLYGQIKTPEQINPRELYEYDLIGFGSGIYSGKHHEFLLDLAYELSPVTGRRAFLFSTCGVPAFAWKDGRIDKGLYDNHLPLREMLTSKGYSVVDEFFCPGYNTFSFLRLFGGINRGRPDDRDVAKAEEFARQLQRTLTEAKVPLDRSV